MELQAERQTSQTSVEHAGLASSQPCIRCPENGSLAEPQDDRDHVPETVKPSGKARHMSLNPVTHLMGLKAWMRKRSRGAELLVCREPHSSAAGGEGDAATHPSLVGGIVPSALRPRNGDTTRTRSLSSSCMGARLTPEKSKRVSEGCVFHDRMSQPSGFARGNACLRVLESGKSQIKAGFGFLALDGRLVLTRPFL